MATISKSPNYLIQQESTFYFRVAIPLALRKRLGRRELRISLETGYLKTARIKAQLLATVATAFFTQAQEDQDMTQRELNALFGKWLKQALSQWTHEHVMGLGKTPEISTSMKEDISNELLGLVDSLRMGKYLGYHDKVIEIAASQGKDIKDDPIAIKHCSHAYVHARRSFLNILLHRLDADYYFEEDELKRFPQISLQPLLWSFSPRLVPSLM
jgi:hypothetical protein